MLKKFLILAVTATILTGCYHSAATNQPNTPAPTPITQTQTGDDTMAENQATINIQGFAFNPKEITVTPGATITITNQDIVGHSFTSDDGTSFDTGVLSQSKSATVTAPTTPGSYSFHCTPHPNMKGTLVVKAN